MLPCSCVHFSVISYTFPQQKQQIKEHAYMMPFKCQISISYNWSPTEIYLHANVLEESRRQHQLVSLVLLSKFAGWSGLESRIKKFVLYTWQAILDNSLYNYTLEGFETNTYLRSGSVENQAFSSRKCTWLCRVVSAGDGHGLGS